MKSGDSITLPSAPRRPALAARRAGRRALTLATDQRAVSHVVFFIISAAIFIPVVGGMFLFMQDASESLVDPSAGLSTKATSLLQQMTGSPGLSEQHGAHWEAATAKLAVKEAGLRHVDAERLDYNKVSNLQRGGLSANSNNAFLDYEELKVALRLDDTYDLHLRMYPVVTDPEVDPYGTQPLRGHHVAYVANLTNPAGRDDSIQANALSPDHGEFLYPTATASKEIAALSALGLGTGDVDAGFDGRSYQPATSTVSGYVGNPYTNGLREGDVIGDTDRPYGDLVTATPYTELFWNEYFIDPDNDDAFRFDAIVFGGGVNLQRWASSLAASDDPNRLTAFVEQGGTVIFMGKTNDPGDFVTACTTQDCLLYQTGSLPGATALDETNQMLSTPNSLSHASYGTTGTWPVCDQTASGGADERDGFIPVLSTVSGDCFDTTLGATSSDRYGATGGTVLVNAWDMSGVSQTETSRALANMLSYGILRTAYLDFGPSIPDDAPVESATRLLLMEMPDGEYLEIRMLMYLWRN